MWNRLVFCLFYGVFRCLHRIWPPVSAPLPRKPARILVFSMAGIGDSLSDSPAIRALKETWPDSRVTVVTHVRRQLVVSHNPFIDERVPHRKSPVLFWRLWRRFRRERPDLVVILRANDPDIWPLAYLINRRAVVSCPRMTHFGFLISHPVPIPAWDQTHGVEQTLEIVRAAGADTAEKGMIFEITPEETRQIKERFSAWLGQKPLIVFQAGGGKRAYWRDWPPSHYAEVIRRLGKLGEFEIALTGGPDNADRAAEIERTCGTPVKNLVGQLTLTETASLVKEAVCLVSTDTGVMHLGFAVGTPTVALIHCNNPASRVGPYGYGDRHPVLQLEPGPGEVCSIHIPMDRISPQSVCEKVASVLRRAGWEVSI